LASSLGNGHIRYDHFFIAFLKEMYYTIICS